MQQKVSGQLQRKGGCPDRGCLLNTPKQKDMTAKTEPIGGRGGLRYLRLLNVFHNGLHILHFHLQRELRMAGYGLVGIDCSTFDPSACCPCQTKHTRLLRSPVTYPPPPHTPTHTHLPFLFRIFLSKAKAHNNPPTARLPISIWGRSFFVLSLWPARGH